MAKPIRPKPLRIGVDYYFENGCIVLTRAYHLKRGRCCGSDCRHCPYQGGKGSRIKQKN